MVFLGRESSFDLHFSRILNTMNAQLPTFLLIGAPRSGSTSMAAYLQQHPSVYMSRIKEPSYFLFDDGEFEMGGPFDAMRRREMVSNWERYQNLFQNSDPNTTAVGEASVRYLYSSQACAAIHRRLPGVKLLVGLRNPVERAFSHYQMLRGSGVEPCATFAEALADGSRREAESWFIGCHRALGFYSAPLQRYIDTFGRESLFIYLYDDLVSAPQQLLHDLFTFLEIDPSFEPDLTVRHNMGADIRNPLLRGLWKHSRGLRSRLLPVIPNRLRGRLVGYIASRPGRKTDNPQMSATLRTNLLNAYRDEISTLEKLIDRDLSAWREVPQLPGQYT